ncbi:unnamed protein product, partial [Hapterophycus canaliculatus]
RVDLETGTVTILGAHEKPVRCVEYNASTGTVLTGGWDAKFNAWDPRAKQALVQSRPVPGKVRAPTKRGDRVREGLAGEGWS